MRRPLTGIQLSKVNTALLTTGATLLLAALLSRWVTIGGNQIAKGAPWWVPVLVATVGVLAVALGLLASREQLQALWTVPGFLGTPPKMPDRLVSRPDVAQQLAAALRAGHSTVALTGIGGTGKSTVAAGACLDRWVQRRFRAGVTWLEAGPGRDPVVLLGDLGRRLGLPDSESGFTTVAQGRDKIAALLAGKQMLVAVDNVWERDPVDAVTGLADDCTVLFTTRLPSLAITYGATQIPVDELTQEQALELLDRWTGQTPGQFADAARELCTRVGNLPLGVTMAGAMVAQGRSFTDVLALIEQDPARVRADLNPKYPYPDLLAAIGAGISDLPEAAQQRYAQLAVFAGRGPFPPDAAGFLWGLREAEVGDLFAELVGRSLLTAAGAGRYTAHDLQYDVLKHRLGRDGLAATHARLVESYRTRYPGGWAASATDPYLAGTLAGHLHDADRGSELRALLADVDWIQARLAAAQLPGLLADYRYAGDPLSQQIAKALRMSAHTLTADPGQARGQLAGRLLGHPDPAVAAWATALTTHDGPGAWLAPLTPALTPTTTALEQTLTGHDGPVSSVSVTADGTRAVTGGHDGTVRVWDLATAREQTFTGHDGPVSSVSVTADGTRAVTGGHDGTVRVWDLATGREQAQLTGHRLDVWSVAVSADGTRAVTGGYDGTVRVWDLATGREQAQLTGHRRQDELGLLALGGQVSAVAISADGTVVVSGGGDGMVGVWDLATGREQAQLTIHVGPVGAVALSAAGTRALIGGLNGTVWVWDLGAGREPVALSGHRGDVWSVAVIADGTRAVSGGQDGTVRVWDLATGREQAELIGHRGDVGAVAVTADGTRAVSGGRDGTVRVWDLASGREQAQLTGHDEWVLAVAVTADGTRAVSGSRDGTVRVWDLGTGKATASWTEDSPVIACIALSGQPLKIAVGRAGGQPYLLELRGETNAS